MQQRYRFSIYKRKNLLEFKMWGLWDTDELEVFARDFKKYVDQLSSTGEGFNVLVDLSEFSPQKPEIREGIKKGMQYAITKGMNKSARVVPKKLTMFQMKRLAYEVDLNKFGHFKTKEEALDWLFNQQE